MGVLTFGTPSLLLCKQILKCLTKKVKVMAGLFLFFIVLIAFATLANGYVVSLNK